MRVVSSLNIWLAMISSKLLLTEHLNSVKTNVKSLVVKFWRP